MVLALLGLAAAWHSERGGCDPNARDAPEFERAPSLLRDLFLVALGLGIIRLIPLAAELDNLAMLRFTLVLGGAVAVPYLVSRFLFRDRATGFPWRGTQRWGRVHWVW